MERANPTDREVDGLPKRQRTVVLAVMMAGTTAACISQSMMIAALPTIMHEYSVSASLGQLLTTSYIFTLGLISAMTAYLVHRVDSKKLFIAAMVCFVAGCAAALVAPNYPLLLASRLLQAGGAGIALPLIQVVALSVYPKSEYGRAMGLVGLIIGFAPAIGPTVSGFLIDFWGWRSVFVILGAVSAVVVVLSFFVLSDVVKREGSRERFDVPSGLLYTLGFCGIMLGTTVMESDAAFDPVSLAALAGGALHVLVGAVQCRIVVFDWCRQISGEDFGAVVIKCVQHNGFQWILPVQATVADHGQQVGQHGSFQAVFT